MIVDLAQPLLVFPPPLLFLFLIPLFEEFLVASYMEADHLHCLHLQDAGVASSVPLLHPIDIEAPDAVV